MTCPREPVLTLLVDGELGDADSRAVRRHLEGCAACRARTNVLQHLDALLAPAEPGRMPDLLRARIRALPPPRRRPWGMIAASAAAAVLLAVTWLSLAPAPESAPPAPAPAKAAVASRAPALPRFTRRLAEREETPAPAETAARPADEVAALRRLLDDRDRREAAARTLAALDTEAAAGALFAMRRFPEVRAAFALAGPRTEAWLLDRIHARDGGDRVTEVRLLGRCGGPAAVFSLLALAEEPALAPAAIRALGRIGGDHGVNALAVLAGDPRHRRAAVKALGATGEEDAVAELAGIAASHPDLLPLVTDALARIPSEAAARAIVDLNATPGRPLARRALRALEAMDADLVKPVLASAAPARPDRAGHLF